MLCIYKRSLPGCHFFDNLVNLLLWCIQGTWVKVALEGHLVSNFDPGHCWVNCPVKSNRFIARLCKAFKSIVTALGKDGHRHDGKPLLCQQLLHLFVDAGKVGQSKSVKLRWSKILSI